ncbi:MAG TPA: hypothetical protein VG937_00310 [Polyangiaceae bacterium]|nr:hypothetical protein [Polyangiaceae bacterium]
MSSGQVGDLERRHVGQVLKEVLTVELSRPGDLGKFKVPGLRNVGGQRALHARQPAGEARRRDRRGDGSTDALIEPLALSSNEKEDLLTLLRVLTDVAFLSDRRFQP